MYSTINKVALKGLARFFPTQKPTLFLGEHALLKVCQLLVNSGVSKPILVVDGFLLKSGALSTAIDYLSKNCITVTIFDEIVPNPTRTTVEQCVAKSRAAQCDGVLVIGGGSAIDVSKVMAASLNDADEPKRLAGLLKVKRSPLPFYAVPTTSGTGSEVTPASVISDPVTHQKQFYVDPKYVPLAAGLDPSLIASLPAPMTAATGMDALTHAIEAFISIAEFNDANRDALTAIRLLMEYLPRAFKHGEDIEAREMVALASYLAGYAFAKSGLGYVHAISHQLSAKYNTPHGLANAMILPHVIKFNRSYCVEKYAVIERMLSAHTGGIANEVSDDALSYLFVRRIEELGRDLAIAPTLNALKPEDFTAIVRGAQKEARSSYAVPKKMKNSDIEQVLAAISPDSNKASSKLVSK